MRQFAVIGLGRFGSTASLELMKMGHEVLGIDHSPKVVEKYADDLTQAVIVDATDKAALQELGLDNYDVVMVAIGSDFQASLLSVVHLKRSEERRVGKEWRYRRSPEQYREKQKQKN